MPADNVPPLEEFALEGLMLSNSELSKIADVDLDSLYTAEEMNDNADLVSDADCLGAIYPGEDAVYDGTDWSAVRDELLLESGGEDDSRLVEQTVVLFGNRDDAVDFFDKSKDVWHECATGQGHHGRRRPVGPRRCPGGQQAADLVESEVSGSVEGTCSHSMGIVSNLIVRGILLRRCRPRRRRGDRHSNSQECVRQVGA